MYRNMNHLTRMCNVVVATVVSNLCPSSAAAYVWYSYMPVIPDSGTIDGELICLGQYK